MSKVVDIGIITKREVDSLKKNEQIAQQEQRQFQLDWKAFLTRTSEKLLEKCPLKFPVVRFLRCLDPYVMAGSISNTVKLFERLLSVLLDAKRVKETEVDLLKKEYTSFFSDDVHGNPRTSQEFKEYDKVSSERVDCYLATYL